MEKDGTGNLMQGKKFYIETFGCRVNQNESQAISEAWRKLGAEETDRPDTADYVVINSCAITGKAERDARNAVYRLRRLAPAAKIVLCGCAAQFFYEFEPRAGAIWDKPDYCISQSKKAALLYGPSAMPDVEQIKETFFPVLSSCSRARPVIKLQDGCSQHCSFCIVPQTRGRSTSRDMEEILKECKNLLNAGFSELVLSGVNLRLYKNKQCDFWDILDFLEKNLSACFSGFRLRISSLDPAMLTDKGIQVLKNSRFVCPHLHLSLQHVSAEILKAMNRGHYSAEKILNAVEKIRGFWPLMGLGADIIAGFPGESEKDILELEEFLKLASFSYGHVFPFSGRQNTDAIKLPCQIKKTEKQQRAGRIRKIFSKLKKDFLKKQLGLKEVAVVPDRTLSDGAVSGRAVNEFYTVCVLKNSAQPYGLARAKPAGIEGDNLIVELIENNIE